AALVGDAADDPPDALVDGSLELPVLRHPVARRHGHLDEADPTPPPGLPLEETLEAAQPLDDPLGVVEAVDPEQHHLAAEVVPQARRTLSGGRLGCLRPEVLVIDADG